MLTRLIVNFACLLKASANYRNTKLFFYNLLENPESRIKSNFNVVMICLVLSSVFLLIYEVDTQFTGIERLFEYFLVTLFIIEYLLRAWLYNDVHKIILENYEKAEYLNSPFRLGKVVRLILAKKIEYIFTPLAVIDLLAILPSYRPVKMLQVLLIFRLLKLLRYFKSLNLFAEILSSKRFELYNLITFLGFLVFIGSTGIYLFEHPTNSGEVGNLFDAAYWAIVTVSSVGYGDIAPKTTGGRLVAMALILTGLGVLSFVISIIVSAFNDKMQDLRENRTYAELKRYPGFVIICGFGRVGLHIASQLEKHRQRFVVIDSEEVNALKARRLGYLVIHADASKYEVLINAGIRNRAAAVLCATGDDVVNVYITLTSRHLNPAIRIISRANSQDNVKKLYQAGADNVIQPFEIAAMVVAEYIGQPVAFEAILGIIREEKQIIMETLIVHSGSVIDGISIFNVDLEHRKLMLVGVISANPVHRKHKNSYKLKNEHFYFNPDPNFVLRAGDLLVVLGREIAIDYFRDQIEKSRIGNGLKP
ncbi:MAG: NAD-binding protein [Methylococcales bacterium]|nr:NAD-binding protein [Methylococcales bacterium]